MNVPSRWALRLGVGARRTPLGALPEGLRVCLVFAHMDDEINACGLITRLVVQKASVETIVLTDGAANPWTDARVVGSRSHFECRRDELHASLEALGAGRAVLPALPDGKLDQHVNEATRVVEAQFRTQKPHLVITFERSGLNGHRDHCATHVVTRRAIRATGVPTMVALMTPPPPFCWLLGSRHDFGPAECRTLCLTDDEVRLKARLVELYASQARTLRLMMGGLPPRRFFSTFNREWYFWLDGNQALEWATACE